MNLKELIKEHDLKEGDEVICVESAYHEYEVGKVYPIEFNIVAGEFRISEFWTGYSGTFEVHKIKSLKGVYPPHIHCKEIKAWADGAIIQYYSTLLEGWTGAFNNTPAWNINCKYRVKPDNFEEIQKIEKEIAGLEKKMVNDILILKRALVELQNG